MKILQMTNMLHLNFDLMRSKLSIHFLTATSIYSDNKNKAMGLIKIEKNER